MKIFDRGIGTAGGAEAARTQETARSGRSDGQKAGGSQAAGRDSVELSSAAGTLRRAMETGASARAGRVEALQAAYRAGTYAVDPLETSRAMVREAVGGQA